MKKPKTTILTEKPNIKVKWWVRLFTWIKHLFFPPEVTKSDIENLKPIELLDGRTKRTIRRKIERKTKELKSNEVRKFKSVLRKEIMKSKKNH